MYDAERNIATVHKKGATVVAEKAPRDQAVSVEHALLCVCVNGRRSSMAGNELSAKWNNDLRGGGYDD